MVKGINFLSAVYHVPQLDQSHPEVSLPVAFRLVAKTEQYVDQKDGKTKRRSPISKNEHYQALLRQAKQNQILFRFVLSDVWYASAENMRFVKHELDRDFIMPLKTNRKIALSEEGKRQGQYVRVDSLPLQPGEARIVFLEGVDFPLVLSKQLFVNEDGSQVAQYLVCSDAHDVQLTSYQITTIYATAHGGTWKSITSP
jgi:hypothetical protein